jgi:AhpD family alkylhydroperoxidase
MTRLPGPEDGANPAVRATYAISRKRYGKVPEPVSVMAHHPALLAAYSGFELALERMNKLDERLKLLAELKAAAVAGCEWCLDFGTVLARDTGVTEAQLRELHRHRESDEFDELERLVLDYAEGISSTPTGVSDEVFAALREQLDPAQLVELTALIAQENWRARFNWAFEIEPQGFSAGGFCPLPQAKAEAQTKADA